jgi:hypothetical protein
MTELSWEGLLRQLTPALRKWSKKMAEQDGVEALVVFQNLQPASRFFNTQTLLAVGPGCENKTVDQVEGRGMYTDRPKEMWQFPVIYLYVPKRASMAPLSETRAEVYFGETEGTRIPIYCLECGAGLAGFTPGVIFDAQGYCCHSCGRPLLTGDGQEAG